MKDCDGNILEIGDRVAVQSTEYRTLKIGTVVGFTAKKVQIQFPDMEGRKSKRTVDSFRLAKVFKNNQADI